METLTFEQDQFTFNFTEHPDFGSIAVVKQNGKMFKKMVGEDPWDLCDKINDCGIFLTFESLGKVDAFVESIAA